MGRKENLVHKRGAGTAANVNMRSYISHNKETGVKCLTIFYDRRLNDFNQAIEKGLSDRGLEPGKIQVIALPICQPDCQP